MASDLGLTTLSGSAAALNADAIASTNIFGYKTASIQITGTFVGVLSFQASNDGTNFFPVYAEPIGGATQEPVTATSQTGIYHIPLNFSYIRVRMTTYTSGTATVNADLYLEPISEPVGPQFVSLNGGRGIIIQNNATLTANGSFLVNGMAGGITELLINIKNNPTGTTPNIKFSMTEVDPVDGTTQVGTTMSSVIYSATATDTLSFISNNSTSILVSWTVTGASASFTGVNLTLTQKLTARNPDMEFGSDGRIRTGQESLLFFDPIDGTAVNTNLWTQSQLTMTQAVASSLLTLNSGSNTASENYSILTSAKRFLNFIEFPMYVQFQARLIPQTNAVIELGFGTVSTTSAPTDGAFLRIDSSGTMRLVSNFNGTETTSNPIPALNSAQFYQFELTIFEDHVELAIASQDNSYSIDVSVITPTTQGGIFSTSHQPIFARIYNTAITSGAAQIIISNAIVQRMDLVKNKEWGEVLASISKNGITDPSTFAQTANYANSAAPVAAALSNTTPSYTTLGGQFLFTLVAGAETDYALFAYQIPTGFSFHITDIFISARAAGSANTNAIATLEWGLGVNSSAASLATGAPNPPMRVFLGIMSNEINGLLGGSLNVGNLYTPNLISFQPKTPVVCEGGRYVHIIMKESVGAANANQQVRGIVTVLGYFE